MKQQFKEGTRIYHEGFDKFGIFIKYANDSTSNCFATFGDNVTQCVSLSQIEYISDEMFHQRYTEYLVNKNVMKNSEIDRKVLQFIYDFMLGPLDTLTSESYETMCSKFMSGYCYYFAIMLKTAFNRGEVCLAAPFGHIVWKDDNDMVYDAEGVSATEAVYFIPISYLGDGIEDFMHVAGKSHFQNKEDALQTIVTYCKDNNIIDERKLKFCMKIMNFNDDEINYKLISLGLLNGRPKGSLLGAPNDAYRLKQGNYTFTNRLRRDMVYEGKEYITASGSVLHFICGKEYAIIPWGYDNFRVDGAVYLTEVDNYTLTFDCDDICKDSDGVYHIKGYDVNWDENKQMNLF